MVLKPSEANSRTASRMRGLSSSLTETNTVPERGRLVPPPIWLLAKAISNAESIPITSPVDFISGPSTVSTPGKRANGNTASFTARCLKWLGLRLKLKPSHFKHRAVKEAVFPFARFPGVDTVLGPEMKSTGEVMGIDASFEIAFVKSQIGGGAHLPRSGTVFVSVKDADKPRILDAVRLLASLGFKTIATSGTQRYLAEHGVEAAKVFKVLEGRPHIVDAIKNGRVQLVL